jgi:hypothetical protein
LNVKISKIGSITTNKTHLTISAFCLDQNVKVDDINVERKATLHLGENKLTCTVSSVSKNKGGSYALALKIPDSLSLYQLVHPYHHKSNLNFSLLLHENVDPDLFDEADRLLDSAVRQTGRKRADILCEVTAFRNFPGKKDLGLVSAKQLPIVIEKLKEQFQSDHDKETSQS